MTPRDQLTRRIEEHRYFASGLAAALHQGSITVGRYFTAVTDCNMALGSMKACDGYLTHALARIEEALPSALEEIDALVASAAAEKPKYPPPSTLAGLPHPLVDAGRKISTEETAHQALFDSVIAYARASRPAPGPSPLAAFAASYHELLHVRIVVGRPELEVEAVNKVAAIYEAAKRLMVEAVPQQPGAPPPFEPTGDAGRLNATRSLPSDFRYHPPAQQKKSPPSANGKAASDMGSSKAPASKRKKRAPSTAAKFSGSVAAAVPLEAAPPSRHVGPSTLTVHTPTFKDTSVAWADLVEGQIYDDVPLAALAPHPENDRLFAPVDAIAQREFEQDIKDHGTEHPLLACGTGGFSPPGTILRGHRRHAALLVAGATSAPLMFKNGLSASDEIFEMIRGNLADSHARKLTEEAKYLLEEQARQCVGERRGRRRTMGNSVDSNGISGRETAVIVADKYNETANAVRCRHKIFGSPCTTPKLKEAVNRQQVSTSIAAIIVRDIEAEFSLARSHGAAADESVLAPARTAVDQRLTSALTPEPRAKKKLGKERSTQRTATAGSGTAPTAQTDTDSGTECPRQILAQLVILEEAARAIGLAVSGRTPEGTVSEEAHGVLEILAPITSGKLRATLAKRALSWMAVDATRSDSYSAAFVAEMTPDAAPKLNGEATASGPSLALVPPAAEPGPVFTKGSSSGTGIDWAEFTWNYSVGCKKKSDGCANCYAIPAAAANERRGQKHYKGLTKKLKNGELNWTGKVTEAPRHIFEKPLGLPAGSIVFVNSMGDFLQPEAPDDLRLRALDIMRRRPDIAFLALTKCAKELAPFLTRTGVVLPDNLWVGVSVESSAHVDRIDLLRAIPGVVRFLSIEPLLDDVAATGMDLRGIDWVIAGGESGMGARPVAPEWVRHVRDACISQKVAFFHKQWGTWRSNPLARDERGELRKCREVEQLDPHGTGGALLDGQLWREMPPAYWQRWAPLRRPRRHLPLVQTPPSAQRPVAKRSVTKTATMKRKPRQR